MSNKISRKALILTTASILSVSISTVLYAAQPLGVQTTDSKLSAVPGCDTGGVVTPPVISTVLENGVAKTELTASTGTDLVFTMDVPADARNLSFTTTGNSGDADLYVKFGSEPTDSVYDCGPSPYEVGNFESCTSAQTDGTYYVRLKAYREFAGVSLTGSYTEAFTGGGDVSPIERSWSDINVAKGAWARYTLDLVEGYADFTVTTSGGTGDADLYVTYGNESTTSTYDCRPYKGDNNEICNFMDPAQGTWYIDIHSYSDTSGVTLNLQATPRN